MAIITVSFSGDNVEKAIERAVRELNIPKEKLNVEVVNEEKKGIFGIGAKPAKINVSYDDGKPTPKPEQKPAPKPEPKPVAPKPEQKPAPKPESKPAAPKPEQKPAPKSEVKSESKSTPAAISEGEPKPARRESRRESRPANAAGTAGAIAFLEQIIADTGIAAAVSQVEGDGTGTYLEINGSEAGMLIGYHGETLEALQFLSGIVAAKSEEKSGDDEESGRIYLDIEGYKVKREDTLRKLAHKTAEKAIRMHKNIGLDPMPANERRIIHDELSGVEGINTYSVGSEGNRRVIVSIEGKK